MTPAEERDLLLSTSATIDQDVSDATDELVALITAGTPPAEAVQTVTEQFGDDMGDALAFALIALLGASMSSEDALQWRIGSVPLTQRIGAIAGELGSTVSNIVQRQTLAFSEARAIATGIFTDYATRGATGAEALQILRENRGLPQYLREVLLSDATMQGEIQRQMARLQVQGLSSQALREAYQGVLDALDGLEAGQGRALLERRLRAAFYERLRYFAQRIAQTELHRAYMIQTALDLQRDPGARYVQVKRAPGREKIPCMCDLYTGRNRYGLGPGVYPREEAALPPYHPNCLCYVIARPDLKDRAIPVEREESDQYFLRSLGLGVAARVMGSRAKLTQVLNGTRSAEDVASLGRKVPVQKIGEVRP